MNRGALKLFALLLGAQLFVLLLQVFRVLLGLVYLLVQ